MNRNRLDGIERAARRVFAAVELGEAELRRRKHAVEMWLAFRCGQRPTRYPAFLESVPFPPDPFPITPAGLNPDDWRDALDAVATVGARMARRIGPDDHLRDTSARAKVWAERWAAWWGSLVRPGDPLPYFLSEAAPTFTADRDRDAALAAVGVWVPLFASDADKAEVFALLGVRSV